MAISYTEFQDRIAMTYGRLRNNLIISSIKASFEMERLAKNNARSYPKVVTGRLRNSIQGVTDHDQGTIKIGLRAGERVKGSTNLKRRYDYETGSFYMSKVDAPAQVFYAPFVEFGTKHMRPRFFMRRAVEQVQRSVLPNLLNDSWRLAATGKQMGRST